MKIKKQTSFWMSFCALCGIYLATLFRAPEVLQVIGSTIIWGIVVAGGLYQGANVADNGMKGKFYRPELDKGGKSE
jgi:hypothetical protein